MSFPEDRLPIRAEMRIDGNWVDVTSRVRNEADIVINRGRSNEEGAIGAATCDFTLNNRDGLFSDRNPRSQYYGKIGRNTPFRVRVLDDGAFWVGGVIPAAIATPDTGSLDITGNIDLRFEHQPHTFPMTGNRIVMAKWSSGQRSYGTYVSGGGVGIVWTPDGSATTSALSVPIPNAAGVRHAIRVTLDVNNGSGGWTVRWYYSTTVNGSWTMYDERVTTGGTTSINNSTAPFSVGGDGNGGGIFSTYTPYLGRIYAVQVRDGIGGTAVVDLNFDDENTGTREFTDGTGKTFTVIGARAQIQHGSVRFYGEVSSFPQDWDSTGKDVWISTSANGLISRLTQGATPLRSPIYRYLSDLSGLTGYWPMEDDGNATVAGNVVSGGYSAQVRNASFGYEETLPASEGVITLGGDGPLVRGVARQTTSGSVAGFLAYFKFPDEPLSETPLFTVTATTSNIKKWIFSVSATSYILRGYNFDNDVIVEGAGTYDPAFGPAQWSALYLEVSDNGSNLKVDVIFHNVGRNNFGVLPDFPKTFSGTSVGRFTEWKAQGVGALQDVQIAHVATVKSHVSFVTNTFAFVSNGYSGERAGVRFQRLCEEENIDYYVIGSPSDTEAVGVQTTAELMDLMDELAQLDGGMVFDAREDLALVFRTRRSFENQPGLVLNYGATNDLSGKFVPVDDDQLLRNDVTVKRPAGSFARSVLSEGRLSTQRPPDGVGRYDTAVTLNAASDLRLPFLADRLLAFGTMDDLRYPSVEIELARKPFRDEATGKWFYAQLTELGDRIDVVNISPEFLPPDSARMHVQGYRETLKNREWGFSWNTSPYILYDSGTVVTNGSTGGRRADADRSTLDEDLTTSETLIDVDTDGQNWTTNDDHFPFDIVIGGEVMRVTDISGSGVQTFTVERSINGIVKEHSSGASVHVYRPLTFGV